MSFLDKWFRPNVTIDEEVLEELFNRIGIATDEAKAKAIDTDTTVSFSDKYKEYQDAVANNHQAAAALGAVYMKVAGTRKEMVRQIEEIKKFYITDVLLTQFADDALAPDSITNDVITIRSDNKEVDKALKELDNIVKFDSLITENISDILAYGEYTLGCKATEGKGIEEITDNVDQANVVSLTKQGEIEGFLELDYDKRRIEVVAPYKYVKFAIPSHKIRIDLNREFGGKIKKDLADKVPQYIRIGKSFLFPLIEKIKELELLEQLIPATNLAKLTSGTLLGVQVPQGIDPQKGMEVARKIEGLINKKIGVDTNQKFLTVENILSTAGKLKVIPVFGDKGQVTKFDYKQDEPDNLMGSVQDVRRTLCSSMGIPYELIFGGESDDTKGHLLKRYARYLRKLKQIQKALATGCRQICFIHLVNKGISFKPEDVVIEFRNKLIEIDAIDKLEFLDTTVQMMSNAKQFLQDLMLDVSIGPAINIGAFLGYVNDQFATLGIVDVIDMEVAKKIKILPPPPVEEEPPPGE